MTRLETRRLLLRRYQPSDLEALYLCLSDPAVVRFEPYCPMSWSETQEALAQRIASEGMIAVERTDDHQLIGNLYLGRRDFDALELGYVFRRDCWGQGYAAESCAALIEQAFGQGVHRIFAECDPENEASWRLLERLGFQREAHLRRNLFFWRDETGAPIWKDTFIYAKLNEL